jgi:hypothetical protein
MTKDLAEDLARFGHTFSSQHALTHQSITVTQQNMPSSGWSLHAHAAAYDVYDPTLRSQVTAFTQISIA